LFPPCKARCFRGRGRRPGARGKPGFAPGFLGFRPGGDPGSVRGSPTGFPPNGPGQVGPAGPPSGVCLGPCGRQGRSVGTTVVWPIAPAHGVEADPVQPSKRQAGWGPSPGVGPPSYAHQPSPRRVGRAKAGTFRVPLVRSNRATPGPVGPFSRIGVHPFRVPRAWDPGPASAPGTRESRFRAEAPKPPQKRGAETGAPSRQPSGARTGTGPQTAGSRRALGVSSPVRGLFEKLRVFPGSGPSFWRSRFTLWFAPAVEARAVPSPPSLGQVGFGPPPPHWFSGGQLVDVLPRFPLADPALPETGVAVEGPIPEPSRGGSGRGAAGARFPRPHGNRNPA